MAHLAWVLALLLFLAPRPLHAAHHDAWLPGSGNFAAAIASGAPFLVMSELSVGITDHAALSILGGTTPIVSGFGVRPRGAIPLGERFRILLNAPLVFYPQRSDGPAWWLTRPAAQLSFQPTSNWNLASGAGFVAVATQDAVFGGAPLAPSNSPYGLSFHERRTNAWWTLNALATYSVSPQSELFADVTTVLRGSHLAGPEWIGGPPFILFLGVSTAL